MKLYKYRQINEYTKSILLERDFWASTPDTLNDPFDCDPCFETDETEAGLPDGDDVREQAMLEYQKRVQRLGIVCFSKRWDSILMWSHYANLHEGICIGIDTDRLHPGPKIHPVIYVEERPLVHLFADRENANRITALTKNKEWEYEEEWRWVLEANATSGQPPCTVNFPVGSITEIILGAKVKPEDRERVLGWCDSIDPRPTVYEAFKDLRRYRVDRLPVADF